MLSHICQLENIDLFLLLPQKNDLWTERVRKAGGYPDEVSRSAQTSPAIINVTGNGHIRIKFSTTAKNLPVEELQFAGEIQVSLHTVKKKQASSLTST